MLTRRQQAGRDPPTQAEVRATMGHIGADFGGLLKAMREARRISQSKLAERADFDHSYVSRLESGARMPTRDAVERLASALTLAQS